MGRVPAKEPNMGVVRTSTRSARKSGALLALMMVAFACVATQPVLRGSSLEFPNSLPFAKQFLIPGNYVVGSVDLLPASQGNGFITGTIPVSGVPANAEIL